MRDKPSEPCHGVINSLTIGGHTHRNFIYARCKTHNVVCPNTMTVGSNSIRGTGVYIDLFCVCVVLCRERRRDRADAPTKES
jgi:hypothetical protein